MVEDIGAGAGTTSEAAIIEDAAPNVEGWRDSGTVEYVEKRNMGAARKRNEGLE